MHQLMPKMRRRQTLIHLLLAWLLLAASQHHYITTTIKVQAIESVNFKLRPAQPSSRLPSGYVLPTWVEGKKIHKAPSGPNPVGNHHPPSRS